MSRQKEKTSRKEGETATDGDGDARPPAQIALASIVARFRNTEFQRKTGLALIVASLLMVAGVGAWFGPAPAAGAMNWLSRGLVQAAYVALLALSAWLTFGRSRGNSYLLLLGVACVAAATWNVASGLHSNWLRLEANETIVTFRDEPLDIVGLADIVERNPYVEAYMLMRDAHWVLQDRLDRQFDEYSAAYESYVEDGEFLSVERIHSRYELWRSFYQLADLETLLEAVEATPLETEDLAWTVNLLDVDEQTRADYASDLDQAIATAVDWRSTFIAREKKTLFRIRQSLQVVIDARGRYRFAEGRIVFEAPSDAARFAGKELPGD